MLIEERYAHLQKAKGDLEYRAHFNAMCASSLKFFVNTCLWIFEPRSDDVFSEMPFLLRDYQEEFLDELQDHIEHNRSLLVDKSREMGATWMVEAAAVWCWTFKRRHTFLCGSITEDKIDSKKPDCLFWKFDYLVESLKVDVPWLYPAGYLPKHKTHMKRFNPQMGSYASGEVMGPNFGRSGRCRWIFLDEFAEAAFPASTWASCSRTSPCRIIVFTPKGMNFAGQLANPSKGQPRVIDRITLHWMIDETKNFYYVLDEDGAEIATGHGKPNLDIWHMYPKAGKPVYPWYEEAKQNLKYDNVLVAQEIDVDYNESLEGRMYPQVDRSRIIKLQYDPASPLYLAMDYGVSDMTAFVWFQYDRKEKRFKFIDSFQASGKSIRWYIPFITGQNIELGDPEGGYTDEEMEMIRSHKIFMGRYRDFYGDPAGKHRNPVTATSVIRELKRYGINVKTNDKANRYEARWQFTSAALPFCDFDEDRCVDLVQALRDSRIRATTGKPIHGPESHFRSAVEYAFVNQTHDVEDMRRKFAEELREALKLRTMQAPALLTHRLDTTRTQDQLIKLGEDYDTFNLSEEDISFEPEETQGLILSHEGVLTPIRMVRNDVGMSEEDRDKLLRWSKENVRFANLSDPRAVLKAIKAQMVEMEKRDEMYDRNRRRENRRFGKELVKGSTGQRGGYFRRK
jgi:hypothetical protein